MMQQTDPDYITSGDSLSSRRQSGDDTATSTGPRNKKKRIRNWTEDDRAIHRIFERSRREAFKERLKELASLIPSLRAVDLNRLSKHVVIDESISFIQIMQAERQKTTDSQGSLDALVAERTDILAELNRWRASRGLEARMARSTPAKAVVVEEPAASAGDVPLGALASMDWRGSMASENRPVVLGEPENLAGPTLDDSFDLMAMPVGPVSPASLAGPTMGPLWTRPTEDFATTMDMQANCNNLLDTKQVPPAPLASPDGLMPNYMGLAAEGTGAGGAVIMVDPQTAQAGNGQAIEFAPVDSGSDSIAPLVRCTL